MVLFVALMSVCLLVEQNAVQRAKNEICDDKKTFSKSEFVA